ncbi:MAG: phosphotransferase [Candidatus Hermodarchaeota archaeon]
MRGRAVKQVHGLRPEDLKELLEPELQQSFLHVHRSLVGGMANINLLVTSDSDTYVLKLPGLKGMDYNPFEYEFSICSTLVKDGLCPQPVTTGFLPDALTTPFMVYRYEPGTVHSNLQSIVPQEFTLLGDVIHKLKQESPPNARVYSKPSEYIDDWYQRIQTAVNLSKSDSLKIQSMASATEELHHTLGNFVDTEIFWSGSFMHGDLRPNNIVFQESRALLLDWSESSYGESLLDIAYLLAEPRDEWTGEAPLVDSEIARSRVEALKILSLMSAVSWTTERLIRVESGQVEENLADPKLIKAMFSYLQEKTELLKQQISMHFK